eukprot:9537013-Alexandrium_andersonii.AAC.1
MDLACLRLPVVRGGARRIPSEGQQRMQRLSTASTLKAVCTPSPGGYRPPRPSGKSTRRRAPEALSRGVPEGGTR